MEIVRKVANFLLICQVSLLGDKPGPVSNSQKAIDFVQSNLTANSDAVYMVLLLNGMQMHGRCPFLTVVEKITFQGST